MISSDIPDNETERLRALYDYQILDTLEEEAFDQLTELASSICGKPIALISLVDDKRQWFKSHYGLAVNETPREESFCAHAIHRETIFEVEDCRDDERFHDNPLVTDVPQIVFYAGAPLLTPTGHRIGTLCVIDHKPSRLNKTQRRDLQILAKQVVAQLELKKASRNREQTFATLLSLSKKIEQRNEQLEQFVYTVSHDLKAPLVSIGGFSTTLLNELDDILTEKQRHRLNRILDNVNHMGELLDDLLALSRVIKLESKTAPLDIQTIVDVRWKRLSTELRRIDATLTIDAQLHTIVANKTLVGQCIMNLLSNAIRYREPTRALTLRIYTEENQDWVSLSVEDNGIGIDEGDFERIFSIFQKVNIGHGTGIGLSIVKAAMDKHEGSVKVSSTKGVGSTFTLFFPKV